MKPTHYTATISFTNVALWYILVNVPLLAFTGYVHYLLLSHGYVHGNTLLENIGLWILVMFKLGGANLILANIFSDFKIK